MKIWCFKETTGQKILNDIETREKELQKDAFRSKIGTKTAEISQFKDGWILRFYRGRLPDVY